LSPLVRWTLRIGIGAAISAVSILGTLVYVAVQPKPSVPLTADLHGEWAAVSREFNRRVTNRFPVGSSETHMTDELQREGFSRDDWSYANVKGGEAKAMRREDGIPCAQAAYVFWRADATGRLTAIRGVYQEEGCL
jgi:hypothetical protein